MELFTEEIWMGEYNCAYSVVVYIWGTRISANGKGISKEYALASAYGELIERVQAMIYFRISCCFSLEEEQKCIKSDSECIFLLFARALT